MSQYQYATAPAQQQRSGTDVAAWALVALIVALVCAAAGWAIASRDTTSGSEAQELAYLAARDGQISGTKSGMTAGAAAGRKEAALRAQLQQQQAVREAKQRGFAEGQIEGRNRAMARSFGEPYFSTAGAGAYPAAGYEDILASGAFSDYPGYADSAYLSSGYGTGGAAPSAASTDFGASLYGDDFLY